MISAAAFCPMAPVLVPALAQGGAPELDDLRSACRTAIERIASSGRRIVLIGPGETSRSYGATSRGTFAGFGLPLAVALGSDDPGPTELPLSLTVGAWLLRDVLGPGSGAVGWSVADAFDPELESWDDSAWWAGEDVAVLVVGDGSARRTLKAPGYFDDRAAAFDATVAAALASGQGDRLHGLYDERDQLQTGTAVWELAANSLEGQPWDAELLYDDAPYGVGYFVAAWTARPAEVEAVQGVGTEPGWGTRALRRLGLRPTRTTVPTGG